MFEFYKIIGIFYDKLSLAFQYLISLPWYAIVMVILLILLFFGYFAYYFISGMLTGYQVPNSISSYTCKFSLGRLSDSKGTEAYEANILLPVFLIAALALARFTTFLLLAHYSFIILLIMLTGAIIFYGFIYGFALYGAVFFTTIILQILLIFRVYIGFPIIPASWNDDGHVTDFQIYYYIISLIALYTILLRIVTKQK